MSGTGRLLAILAIVVGVSLPVSPVLAQDVDLALDFSLLEPGIARSESFAVELERQARLQDVRWVTRSGVLESADLSVELCRPSGCFDLESLRGTFFDPGTIEVTVTVTLSPSSDIGGTGSALGQLTFVSDDDLPLTGSQLAERLAWALAMASFGALLVALARRREGVGA